MLESPEPQAKNELVLLLGHLTGRKILQTSAISAVIF